MTGATPRYGWTIPDATDTLVDIPAIVAAGIRNIEDSFQLPPNAHTSSDLSTAYPLGMSQMPLGFDAVSSGGWPRPATNAHVITFRRINGENAVQFFVAVVGSGDHPLIWFRTAITGLPWSPFTKISGEGQAWATDSGKTTFTNNSASTSRTITFNANAGFTSAPNVTASTHDGGSNASVSGITSVGFTLSIDPNGPGTTMPSTLDRTCEWIAMQSYT